MSSSSRISSSSSHAEGSNRAPQSAPSSKKSRTDKVTTELVQKSALFRQSTSLFVAEFQFLEMNEVAKAGLACKTLLTISHKEVIWRSLYVGLRLREPSQGNDITYRELVRNYFAKTCRKISECLNESLSPEKPYAATLTYRPILQTVAQHRDSLAVFLYKFARENLLECVKIITQSPSMNNPYRGQAVTYAVFNGHLAVIQELLKDNAIISVKDRVFAINIAARNGYLTILQELLKVNGSFARSYRGHAVNVAADNGHLSIVQELLRGNALIPDMNRENALINASIKGFLAIVQELLKGNASITTICRGYALKAAVDGGHLSVVQELLKGNVVFSEEERGGLVIKAAEKGFFEIIQFLLNGGAIPNHNRTAAIKVAQARNFSEIVKLLTQ